MTAEEEKEGRDVSLLSDKHFGWRHLVVTPVTAPPRRLIKENNIQQKTQKTITNADE